MKCVTAVTALLMVLALTAPASAQEVEQRDFGAAVRSQQFQERVEMFRQMGMEEEATFYAMLTSGEMDASQMMLLMMMMGDGGEFDDAFGLVTMMNAMKQGQGAAQPVVIDRGEVLLIVEGGVLYKISPETMEVQVAYAMNEKLVGVALGEIANPAETILFFEMNVDTPSPVGGPDIVPEGGIHNGGINVGYADGHCKWIMPDVARQQLGEPVF